MYKQLTIMSGKGGTGKTTLTSAFCRLAQGRIVIVDADVDAPNLHLLLEHRIEKSEEFIGGQVARIDTVLCTGCGECSGHCQFDAIFEHNGKYQVSESECEGCGVCGLVCPVPDAISLNKEPVGKLFQSITPYGRFFHAQLYPGGESSGQVVTLLRERAEDSAVAEHKELILIDGPPGIGCSAVASLTGVSLVLVVAEPTVSGWHDMLRAVSLANFFRVSVAVCVNRADINPEITRQIEQFCKDNGYQFLGSIPFDETVVKAQLEGQSVLEVYPDSPASLAIERIFNSIQHSLF